MSDYVLEVRYGEDNEPVQVRLNGFNPDDAEIARQSLVTQVEHAVTIEAPEIRPDLGELDPDVTIEPARVTSVDLVEPTVGD